MNKNILLALALFCTMATQSVFEQRNQEETEQLYAYKQKVRTSIQEINAILDIVESNEPNKPENYHSGPTLWGMIARFEYEIKTMLNVFYYSIDGVRGIHYGRLYENEAIDRDGKHIALYDAECDFDGSRDYLNLHREMIYPNCEYFYYADNAAKADLTELISELTHLKNRLAKQERHYFNRFLF